MAESREAVGRTFHFFPASSRAASMFGCGLRETDCQSAPVGPRPLLYLAVLTVLSVQSFAQTAGTSRSTDSQPKAESSSGSKETALDTLLRTLRERAERVKAESDKPGGPEPSDGQPAPRVASKLRGAPTTTGSTVGAATGSGRSSSAETAEPRLVDGGEGMGSFRGPEVKPALPESLPLIATDERLTRAIEKWEPGAEREAKRFADALALSKAQRWDEAVLAWAEFVDDHYFSYPARYNLGVSLAYIGAWKESREALRRAYESGPNAPYVCFAEATALVHLGLLQEAREKLLLVLRLEPRFKGAKEALLYVENEHKRLAAKELAR